MDHERHLTSSPSTGEDRGEGGLILPPHSNSLPQGEREPVSMHRSISKLFVELGLSIYLELREKHLRSSLRNWVFHRLVRLSIGKRLFCGQLLRRQPATSRHRWSTRYDSSPLVPYTGRGDLLTFHNLTVWGFRQEIESVRRFVVGLSFVQRHQSLCLQTA